MQKKSLHTHPKTTFHFEMLRAVITIILIWCSQSLFAQSVGINTNNPDPSASLEVAGTNKGLLIPRISLQSLTDQTTIPNPATALLVYNTNAGLGKVGFYYNSGTAGNPAWSLMGAGAATLTLPFSQVGTNSGPLFLINNNDANSGSIAISGLAINAIGVRGATVNGTGIVGNTSSTGKGVFASAANINGTALEVNGRMQIHGPGQTIGAGKVLTSDANGYATWQNAGGDVVAFSASGVSGGGNQNLADGVNAKVAFAVENYDLSNNYNTVNDSPHSTFITPVSGIYHFDVQISDNAVAFHFLSLRLVLVRNSITTVMVSRLTSNENELTISTDLQLQTGDQVFVQTQQSGLPTVSLDQNNIKASFNGRLVLKQ